jgi:hypothetical protein
MDDLRNQVGMMNTPEDARAWITRMYAIPGLGDALTKSGQTLEGALANAPTDDAGVLKFRNTVGLKFNEALTQNRLGRSAQVTEANQNIAVGPNGELTPNKPAIEARKEITQAGLPAQIAMAQVAADQRQQIRNDQVGPADQRPAPVISVPHRPELTPPLSTFEGTAPTVDAGEALARQMNAQGRPFRINVPAQPENFSDVAKENEADGRNGRLAAITGTPAPAPAGKPLVPGMTATDNTSARGRAKASIAGAGTFMPQAIEFTAKQYLAGDRQAVQGFARSATARIALQNAIVDEAAKQGMSPEQTAAKIAEFAGTVSGSRTVGQRAANISLAATEAQEMIGIVKETSDKFGRTNFVPFNIAIKAYESGTGEPEIAAFGASLNALVNVYARAINPTGVPTVSDKEHARAVLNAVQSPAQVDAVLGIIRRELEIAKKAPQTVRESIREGVVGKGAASSGPVKIQGDDGYNALPKGARYIGPDGIERVK